MRETPERQADRATSTQGGDVFAGFLGLILGGLIGFVWDLLIGTQGWCTVGLALYLAWVAYRYGERFFRWFRERPWWWLP
jgi:hypothetical protein